MDTLARLLSILGHPFAAVALLALADPTRPGVAAAVAGVVIAMLAALVARQRRTGAWSTVDASDRRERPILYAVAVAGVAAGLLAATATSHRELARGLLAVLVLLAAGAALNHWIKSSLHVAFAALAAVAWLARDPLAGLALAGAVPALAWARVRMRRHSVAEVAWGAALGLAGGAVLLAG